MNNFLKLSFFVALFYSVQWEISAQSVVILDDCGVSYIDPQDDSGSTTQTQDTLIYTTSFDTDTTLRSYHIDINAFGGQQVDRTEVFAILPDQNRKSLGQLAFGNCTDCVSGFALVYNDSLYVDGVSNQSSMEMWLLSLNQPAFVLTGNLQTLNGVGRISGTIPPCAIGLEVRYIVFNDPSNTTTQFSTHILCPEVINNCAIQPNLEIDCPNDSIYLDVTLPTPCFSPDVNIQWSHPNGTLINSSSAVLPLSGNEGYFYLTIEDDCCLFIDSVLVENPDFAEAGTDIIACQGSVAELNGSGGIAYFWEYPDGTNVQGANSLITNLEVINEGLYILHAFNEEGCEDTDTLELQVPVPPAPVLNIGGACLGEVFNLEVDNDSVYSQLTWLDPIGNPLPQPAIPDFQLEDFGNYSVVAVDTFGCEIATNFEVSGSEPPTYEYAYEEGCDTTTVYVFPESLTYTWETGDTGSVFYTRTGGIYSLSITDILGCTTVDQLEVPPPDALAVAINVEQPKCPNDFGVIDIEVDNRPFIFSIDGGQNYFLTSNFNRVLPDTYSIVIQDDLGCVQETEVTIFQPDTLGVELGMDSLVVRPNTPISLDGIIVGNVAEYQWIPEDIDTGGPSTEFIAKKDKDIRLVVKDERGCHASDGLQLVIVLGDIYVPNAFSPDGNGRNDYFTFYSDNGSGEQIEVLRLFDRYGALIFEAEDIPLNKETEGWDGTYLGKTMNAGTYTYFGRVRFGNGKKKIFKGAVHLMR